MVTAKIYSAAHIGFDGRLIEVECDASNGLPNIIIVGLANKAIDEAKERMRSSIKNSDLVTPRKRVTLNLAPADLPKDGSCYDLPMAVAVLAASQQIKPDLLKNSLFVGELSLDGSLRPVRGVITHAEVAKQHNFARIFVPKKSAQQASLVDGVEVIGVDSLSQLCKYLNNNVTIKPEVRKRVHPTTSSKAVDFSDIYGQDHAKRALEIAVAGHHNVLLTGPPGAGKTMMARALLSILPPPSKNEIIAITKLHSLAGELKEQVHTDRPFRSPHHTASNVALIGGGTNPRPGEISLANKGILFLDELPEYSRSCLESLRQPLEDRIVTVARAQDTVTFPCDFMLVATQNPDRIDLVIPIQKVAHKHLLPEKKLVENSQSAILYSRINKARTQQAKRFLSIEKTNAHMSNRDITDLALLATDAKEFLESAAKKLSLSARSYMKVIRVARTIADLSQDPTIEIKHISEALGYRPR